MQSSEEWFRYFQQNRQHQRVNWQLEPAIQPAEVATILRSLQAWQLGETSDGAHLLKASARYAANTNDAFYVEAVKLFIKEEQKHGENLGRYLDCIGQPRTRKNWGDTIFRKVRYFNNSMEWWTLAVITVESTGQLFYQALKDATGCKLLKQICTDILIDEAPHLRFQSERLEVIFNRKTTLTRKVAFYWYHLFFYSTATVVWLAHQRVFKAGRYSFSRFMRSMHFKFRKHIGRFTQINTAGRVMTHPEMLSQLPKI